MTTATTQIVITAKDSTAAAFASVNSGLSGLGGAAIKAGAALSAIGATAAIGSFAAFTKQTIDAQDELFKLSQKTGIAVESLAGLEFAAEQSGVELDKVAKATRAFGLLVAESADSTSGAAKKLQQLGLSYKDLKDLSPEKQLLALADALQKFGKEDRAVALTSLLGNRMADLIPLLSGGSGELGKLIEQGKKFNPVTEQSAKQAERFNDQLNVLSKSVSTLGRELIQGMIPGLTRVADTMVSVTQQSGILAGALAGVKQLFIESFGNPKILGDVGQLRREIFKTQETIKSLEVKKDSVFFDKNALLHEQEKLVQLEVDLKKAIGASQGIIAAQDVASASAKKFAISIDESNAPLTKRSSTIDSLTKKINDQGRVESEYIKLLKSERQAQEDLLKPYQQAAASAQERLQSLRQESQAVDLAQREQITLAEAIERTTIARLQEKRAITTNVSAVAEIDKEIAARKQIIDVIKQTDAKIKGTVSITRSVTDDVSQLWIQAQRSIQSTLANGIFNFFDDGLKGMLKNVISTVGRIASEFAALSIAQSIGLSSIFGGASGTVGAAAGGSSLLNSAGAGVGVLGTLKNFGGGLTSGISGFLGGGGVGALALPLLGGFALNSASNAFAGNKTLGTGFTDFMQKIPILGAGFDILAGFFGRAPFKFRQQSLQGEASSSGFEGDITNVFRSKGGLFVGNKHKSVAEQLSREQQDIFDNSIKGFYTAARGFAENLGLSTGLVDSFTQTLQIKSEKGKKLTEESVTEMLSGIGESLAKNVIPSIEEFRKVGEKSFDTFSRLSNEFGILTNAASLLFDKSAEWGKNFVNQFGFGARSAFLEKAGGADAFAGMVSGFAQNFLTDDQRFKPVIESLVSQRDKLGLSGINTREQFTSAVQSGKLNPDQLIFLLKNQDAINQVFTYLEKFKVEALSSAQAVEVLADTLGDLQRGAIQSAIDGWQNLVDTVAGEIDKLKDFVNQLSGAVDDINPQSVDAARAQIVNATSEASRGNITDVSGALGTLSSQSSSGFSNRLDFERSKAFSTTLINGLSDAVLAVISDKQKLTGIYNNNIALIGGGRGTPQSAPSGQSIDIATLLQNLIAQTASSGQYSKDLYNLMRNMTNNGTALNTVAA